MLHSVSKEMFQPQGLTFWEHARTTYTTYVLWNCCIFLSCYLQVLKEWTVPYFFLLDTGMNCSQQLGQWCKVISCKAAILNGFNSLLAPVQNDFVESHLHMGFSMFSKLGQLNGSFTRKGVTSMLEGEDYIVMHMVLPFVAPLLVRQRAIVQARC